MQLLGAQGRGIGDCGQAPERKSMEQPLFSPRPSGEMDQRAAPSERGVGLSNTSAAAAGRTAAASSGHPAFS